ncbi:MAG: hypothetical protein JW833_15835 [Prolixibacteraceae bacterium]|nr:hypothetical protein [Prolixibacteraceae bacterium]
MNFRERTAYQILERKYRSINREVRLSDFNTAKRVGVLWHVDDKEGFRYISDFLKNKQIIFRNFCYKDLSIEPMANSFGKKDTNFWGFPKKGVTEDFMDVEYDLLLNISVGSFFPLEVLTALTPASFKIGRETENENFFDLAIEIKNGENSLYLVKQQIHYIEQFNKNK